MIQLTLKQANALADAAKLYKKTLQNNPELAKKEFGTLVVDAKSEIVQLLDMGLATEESPDTDPELQKMVAELKEAKGISLRVLNLTKEAVMLFMDAAIRQIN